APAIAVGTVAAPRAGPSAVVPAADADIRLGQVVDAGDALGGIGAVFTGSWHRDTPGRGDLPGDTPGGGELFTQGARFPRYSVQVRRFAPLEGRYGDGQRGIGQDPLPQYLLPHPVALRAGDRGEILGEGRRG